MAFRMPGYTFWLTFFGIPFPHTMAPFSLKAINDLLHVPAAILITEQPNSGRKQIVLLSKTSHSRRQTFIQKQIHISTWWSYCPQVQKILQEEGAFCLGPKWIRRRKSGGNKKWSGKKGWQDTGPGVGTDPACALSRREIKRLQSSECKQEWGVEPERWELQSPEGISGQTQPIVSVQTGK